MPHALNKVWQAGRALAYAGALLAVQAAPLRADPLPYLPLDAREAASPRPVGALVPQHRIASSIELGRIAFPSGGGGILGTIIIAGENDIPEMLADRAVSRAEAWIAPLVAALGEFDVPTLAGNATMAALGGAGWLGASPPEVLSIGNVPADAAIRPVLVTRTYNIGLWGPAPNTTPATETWAGDVGAMQRRLDDAHADAGERAQVQWRYQMSPNFGQVQVIADVSIRRRGAIGPFYNQQVISVVRLDRPAFVEEDNVARWTANDAALARTALTMAFARAGEVLPCVLALDEAGWRTATDDTRESATAAGYHGPVLLRDETGPVFWAEDGDQRLAAFVTVQTIRE